MSDWTPDVRRPVPGDVSDPAVLVYEDDDGNAIQAVAVVTPAGIVETFGPRVLRLSATITGTTEDTPDYSGGDQVGDPAEVEDAGSGGEILGVSVAGLPSGVSGSFALVVYADTPSGLPGDNGAVSGFGPDLIAVLPLMGSGGTATLIAMEGVPPWPPAYWTDDGSLWVVLVAQDGLGSWVSDGDLDVSLVVRR